MSWSHDGKTIAYVGHVDEKDPWVVKNQRLWIVDAGGGATTCLTDKDDFCLAVGTLTDTRDAGFGASLEWSPDSKALYTSIGWHGEVQIGYLQIGKPGKVQLLTKGRHAIAMGNVSDDGEKIACTYSDALTIAE